MSTSSKPSVVLHDSNAQFPLSLQMQAAMCATPPRQPAVHANLLVSDSFETELHSRGLAATPPGDVFSKGSDACTTCENLHGELIKSQHTVGELVRQIQGSRPSTRDNGIEESTRLEGQDAATTRYENKYRRAKEELIIARRECFRLQQLQQHPLQPHQQEIVAQLQRQVEEQRQTVAAQTLEIRQKCIDLQQLQVYV